MQIEQARGQYVRWLAATKDASAHTIRAYAGDIRAFERHLGADARIDQIDRNTLTSFFARQRADVSPRCPSGDEPLLCVSSATGSRPQDRSSEADATTRPYHVHAHASSRARCNEMRSLCCWHGFALMLG